jgi:hypothetical protein
MDLFKNILFSLIKENLSKHDYVYMKRVTNIKEPYSVFSLYYSNIEKDNYKKVFILNRPGIGNKDFFEFKTRSKSNRGMLILPFFYGVKPIHYSASHSYLANNFKEFKNNENLKNIVNISTLEYILKRTFPFEVVKSKVQNINKITLLKIGSESNLNNITAKILIKLLKEQFALEVNYEPDIKDFDEKEISKKKFNIPLQARWNPRDCKDGEHCVRDYLKDLIYWDKYDEWYRQNALEFINTGSKPGKEEKTLLGNAKKVKEVEDFFKIWIKAYRGKTVGFKVSNVVDPESGNSKNLRGGFRRFIQPMYLEPEEKTDNDTFYILLDNSVHSGNTIKNVIKVLPEEIFFKKKILGYTLAAETEHSSIAVKLKDNLDK